MITERHSIACRLFMEAIEADSLGDCFVQMNIGGKDCLALLIPVVRNLQIPDGSTNRIIPEWLYPNCFPCKQRFTASRQITSNLVSSLTKRNAPRRSINKWVKKLKTHTCEPYLTTYFKHFKHGLWWPRTELHPMQALALHSKRCGAKGKEIWFLDPILIL